MDMTETYKILVDQATQRQYERVQHFNTTNLAIHSLLISSIGYLIGNLNNGWDLGNQFWVVPLIGFLMGIFWLLGLRIIRNDIGMRYAQLRDLESLMGSTESPIVRQQQIFTEGYKFYKGEKVEGKELQFHQERVWFKGIGYVLMYQILAGVLIGAYGILLFLQLC